MLCFVEFSPSLFHSLSVNVCAKISGIGIPDYVGKCIGFDILACQMLFESSDEKASKWRQKNKF